MTMRIEIIAVGKELVSGRTRDTNSSHIAAAFFTRGVIVKRIIIVDDDLGDIVSAVGGSLRRGTTILLVTGGLGPTGDDMTLQGVAEAAGVRIGADPLALKMVKRKYDELYGKGLVPFPELTRERLKMAAVPSGATPIENPVGVAPGIKLRVGECTIYCLPGVPAEMQGVFDGSVLPELSLPHAGRGGSGEEKDEQVRGRIGDFGHHRKGEGEVSRRLYKDQAGGLRKGYEDFRRIHRDGRGTGNHILD